MDRSPGLRPDHPRQRRRRVRLLRRRADLRPSRQPSARRELHRRRRHGGPVQHLRRPPGPRALEGAVERAPRPGRLAPGLDRRRRRRRDVRPCRIPTDSRWLYTTQQYGGHYRVDQKLGIRTSIAPVREKRQASLPVHLVHAPPHLPAQQPDPLHRRPGPAPLARPGRPLAGDQPRPEHERHGQDPPVVGGGPPGRHPVVRHLVDLGIARHARDHLGRDERREGPAHPERRGGLDRPDRRQSPPREARRIGTSAGSSPRAINAGTAYVAKNGFRNDDFRPFLYKTEDFGATWTSLGSGLPNEPVNVVFEDARNPRPALPGQRHRRLRLARRRTRPGRR